MKIKALALVTLTFAIALPLVLIIWSKAVVLLNQRSDRQVLMGGLLILSALLFVGLSVYLILNKFFRDR